MEKIKEKDDFEDFLNDFEISTKPINHVVFLVDVSGSMTHRKQFIIDSFNEQLKVIKDNKDQETFVSLIFFWDDYKIVHYEQKAENIEFLKDVEIMGMTSLFDIMGEMIGNINKDVKELKDKKKNHSALFVIITDGQDNTSKVFDYDKIKSMMEELEIYDTWTFTFAGVKFDAIGNYSGLGGLGNSINIQNMDQAAQTFKHSLSGYYTMRSTGETKSSSYYRDDNTSGNYESITITNPVDITLDEDKIKGYIEK
jgi:hypothetical protein